MAVTHQRTVQEQWENSNDMFNETIIKTLFNFFFLLYWLQHESRKFIAVSFFVTMRRSTLTYTLITLKHRSHIVGLIIILTGHSFKTKLQAVKCNLHDFICYTFFKKKFSTKSFGLWDITVYRLNLACLLSLLVEK